MSLSKMDPHGNTPATAGLGAFAGCSWGGLGGGFGGVLTYLGDQDPNASFCCHVGCNAIGGCIAGMLPVAALGAGFPPPFVAAAGCIGGFIGSLLSNLCMAGCRGTGMSLCDLGMAVVSGVLGCMSGGAADDDWMIPLFMAIGLDVAAFSQFCGAADGGGGGGNPPQIGVANCTFKSTWSGKVWSETVSCPLGKSKFTCCASRADGGWFPWEILEAS